MVEGGEKARNFDDGVDNGEKGGAVTFDGRVEDISKVTLTPLLVVADVEDAVVLPSLETECIGSNAMLANNEWLRPCSGV